MTNVFVRQLVYTCADRGLCVSTGPTETVGEACLGWLSVRFLSPDRVAA